MYVSIKIILVETCCLFYILLERGKKRCENCSILRAAEGYNVLCNVRLISLFFFTNWKNTRMIAGARRETIEHCETGGCPSSPTENTYLAESNKERRWKREWEKLARQTRQWWRWWYHNLESCAFSLLYRYFRVSLYHPYHEIWDGQW